MGAKPVRMREILYAGPEPNGRGGSTANVTDICAYPVRRDAPGFAFREGMCADFKTAMAGSLDDGLSTLTDAQRRSYDETPGLPKLTNRFDSIIHTQFTEYDAFGNLGATYRLSRTIANGCTRRSTLTQTHFSVSPPESR